jgi:hypothetical protein
MKKMRNNSEAHEAHMAGYNDGLDNQPNKYPEPINEYQKEYNRGYESGRRVGHHAKSRV